MPIVSFKDFTPVQYTDGESEMQDRYAFKRHRGVVGEQNETIGRIRERMHSKGLRRKHRMTNEAAVDAKGHKSDTGGLTQKGRDYYNRKTGGHLQKPVTTKPSQLSKDSKAYRRRKSFCARMSGVKGPMKDEHGKPTRKALALRKWNC